MRPVIESQRIELLDVLRGFALLGILLLNIIGFGLPSASYSNPAADLIGSSEFDRWTWASVELFAEGAMRCLFSMLFGAGVVLFTTGARAKSGVLHYRRNFWLLVLGLFDAYVLLWLGDILIGYAVAGALLYPLRNVRPSRLIALAAVLLVLLSLFYGGFQLLMSQTSAAAQVVESAADPDEVPESTRQMAAAWTDFSDDFSQSDEERAAELELRQESYMSAAKWNVGKASGMIFFVLPVFLLWDALVMMLIGMALFKWGVLQGEKSALFYKKLMIVGFAVGLAVNGFEVMRALASNLDLLAVFAQMQPTYHLGRLGMAVGYIGLIGTLVHAGAFASLRRRLAHVGRMALTNYLMHSVIALFLFTGAGFGLVGTLSRSGLYVVVLSVWIFQLIFSDFWLRRFHFGPVEWVWRFLTYGKAPALRRVNVR